MNGILKYFSPLGTFIVGMVLTLVLTIFFPAIFDAQTALESNAAIQTGEYWALQEVITSTRLIIFLTGFAVTLFLTAKVWLSRKD